MVKTFIPYISRYAKKVGFVPTLEPNPAGACFKRQCSVGNGDGEMGGQHGGVAAVIALTGRKFDQFGAGDAQAGDGVSIGFPFELTGVGKDQSKQDRGEVDRWVTFTSEDDITPPLDELYIGDEDFTVRGDF